MDVVALAQHGIGHAVATLGTACTPAQVQKLVRQTDRIIFCFDGDAAGRRAAWRALENSLSLVTDDKVFSFLFLPPEHDPDTYVRAFGRDAFERQEDAATPLSRFLIDHLKSEVDLDSAEGRAGMVSAARPHLQRIAAPGLRLGVVKGIAELVDMTASEVERLCQLKPQASVLRSAPARLARTPVTPLDEQVLRLLLSEPRLATLAATEDARHAMTPFARAGARRSSSPCATPTTSTGSPTPTTVSPRRTNASNSSMMRSGSWKNIAAILARGAG